MVIAKIVKDVVFALTGVVLCIYVITEDKKVAICLLILSLISFGILIKEKKKIWRNKNHGKNESM